MKNILILLFLLINTLSISQENWTNLIGDDLGNWEIKEGEADFQLVDGTIIGTSKLNSKSTYLGTKNFYKDFEPMIFYVQK